MNLQRQCSGRILVLSLTLLSFGLFGSTHAAELSARDVAGKLDAVKAELSRELTSRLSTNTVRGSYTTVWRQFEDLAIAALADLLPRQVPGLTATNFDSRKAIAGREKNRLADFVIICGTNTIEISIKAARAGENPENDMGTFRDHPNREKLFTASFTVWVRYEDQGEALRAERVFFDRTWRFVGKSALVDGVKYRKKDGNMRPKPWSMFDSGKAYWQGEEEFELAVKRSEVYRANELVKEYLTDLSEDDQKLLHDRLHEKFQRNAPVPR
ncbi:MAG TPA: hypothetical protein VFZ59_12700 [Verrucomicrobiae bacterium]|nr:hypothetical protein [Verrucomicrobiae bacterium]